MLRYLALTSFRAKIFKLNHCRVQKSRLAEIVINLQESRNSALHIYRFNQKLLSRYTKSSIWILQSVVLFSLLFFANGFPDSTN